MRGWKAVLNSQEHFVALREELDAVEEYLDIEHMRFGEKLTIEMQIDPRTLDIVVPSMLLQPLVENSIKHGIEPKLDPGRIIIRSTLQDGHAVIDVIDDGVGVGRDEASRLKMNGSGIGLKNVNERLRVIYGARSAVSVSTELGRGTSVRLEIPDIVAEERASA